MKVINKDFYNSKILKDFDNSCQDPQGFFKGCVKEISLDIC